MKNLSTTSKGTSIRKFIGILILFVGIFGVFFTVASANAQQVDLGLQYAQGTGLTTTDIRVTIAKIIRIAIGLLGIVAVGIVLYGGAIWMMSGGEASKIDKAKKMLINGAIGLTIILLAFGIVQFVLGNLTSTTTGGGIPGGPNYVTPVASFGGGALGKVLRAHYPDRNAIDIARNTKVIITFSEKINNDSIFDSTTNSLNFNNIKIYKSSDASSGNSPAVDANLIKDITVATTDKLTYSFRFTNLLGSPSENIKYTVYLGSGVQKEGGQSVFGSLGGSYTWDFTTGTTIDLVPPQIDSISPVDPAGCPADTAKCNARNKLIQINFNEAIDPTTVTGIVPGFSFISTGVSVAGEYTVSNQYRTVLFTPSTACEGVLQNSCGEKVFCLPAKTEFKMNILAADLAAVGSSQATFPYTGVVDIAGNSLDGNADGKSEGAIKDSYKWTFNTSGKIDLEPPVIVSLSPDVNTSNVALDNDVTIQFNETILASSLFGSIDMQYGTLANQKHDSWGGAQFVGFGVDGQGKVDSTKVVWQHYDDFVGSDLKQTSVFYPIIYSTIKDDAQNCFDPAVGPTSGAKKCEKVGNDWNGGAAFGIFPNCDLTK